MYVYLTLQLVIILLEKLVVNLIYSNITSYVLLHILYYQLLLSKLQPKQNLVTNLLVINSVYLPFSSIYSVFHFIDSVFFNVNMKYHTTPSFIFFPNLLAVRILSSFSKHTLNCPTIALLSAIFL